MILLFMRLFVALPVPENAARSLHDALAVFRPVVPGARWARPEQYHFTLKFLGAVAPERLGEVEEALTGVKAPAFDVTLGGPGFFPTAKRPRVFWIGTVAGGEAVRSLAGQVEEVLAAAGFARETRPFEPHVTLARLDGAARVEKFEVPVAGPFRANRLLLMESRLTPAGPIHTARRTFLLKENE